MSEILVSPTRQELEAIATAQKAALRRRRAGNSFDLRLLIISGGTLEAEQNRSSKLPLAAANEEGINPAFARQALGGIEAWVSSASRCAFRIPSM
jgi:hypothetical protein